jgi:hypothetical protein
VVLINKGHSGLGVNRGANVLHRLQEPGFFYSLPLEE